MAGLSDVAVVFGVLASAALGAALFHHYSGLTAWLALPVGAVLGFLAFGIAVCALIGIANALTSDPEPKQDAGDGRPPL